MQLWEDGYTQGLGESPTVAARRAVAARVAALFPAWLAQITTTTVKLIAKALVAGTAVGAKLSDRVRADLIAVTEYHRSYMQAKLERLSEENVLFVRWVVKQNCCDECAANAAAGPWQLGVPFPSGALAPPDHPNCRCDLERADGEANHA